MERKAGKIKEKRVVVQLQQLLVLDAKTEGFQIAIEWKKKVMQWGEKKVSVSQPKKKGEKNKK